MAPTPTTPWEPSTTIELLTLFLAIPSAIAASATLWILSRRRRRTGRTAMSNIENSIHIPLEPGLTITNEDTGPFDWFQEQYDNLQGEMAAEREEWVEMADREERS